MPDQKINVEKTLVRLEEIVQSLDSEEVSLERSLELFEEGVLLADQLKQKLEESELKVKKVLESSSGFSFSSLDDPQ